MILKMSYLELALFFTMMDVQIIILYYLRDVIPSMNLIEEFGKVVNVIQVPPTIRCIIFEDNTSCIKVASAPDTYCS